MLQAVLLERKYAASSQGAQKFLEQEHIFFRSHFLSVFCFLWEKSRIYADKKTTTRTRTATKRSKTPSERQKLARSLAPIVHTDGWQWNRQTVGFALLKSQEINLFSKDAGNAAAIFF